MIHDVLREHIFRGCQKGILVRNMLQSLLGPSAIRIRKGYLGKVQSQEITLLVGWLEVKAISTEKNSMSRDRELLILK
jgi:hypothetical protein